MTQDIMVDRNTTYPLLEKLFGRELCPVAIHRVIGTCKECRFWRPLDPETGQAHTCVHEAIESCMRRRARDLPELHGRALLEFCPEAGIFALDPDDTADLNISPDFGCIHWEAK